mmetsp:Transcript_20910/g.69821  ORF Transcript_20910/g.69821 Transcript_20910/m.69821 type:complete len:233 (-) Transcript_20910:385-1083(-)
MPVGMSSREGRKPGGSPRRSVSFEVEEIIRSKRIVQIESAARQDFARLIEPSCVTLRVSNGLLVERVSSSCPIQLVRAPHGERGGGAREGLLWLWAAGAAWSLPLPPRLPPRLPPHLLQLSLKKTPSQTASASSMTTESASRCSTSGAATGETLQTRGCRTSRNSTMPSAWPRTAYRVSRATILTSLIYMVVDFLTGTASATHMVLLRSGAQPQAWGPRTVTMGGRSGPWLL